MFALCLRQQRSGCRLLLLRLMGVCPRALAASISSSHQASGAVLTLLQQLLLLRSQWQQQAALQCSAGGCLQRQMTATQRRAMHGVQRRQQQQGGHQCSMAGDLHRQLRHALLLHVRGVLGSD